MKKMKTKNKKLQGERLLYINSENYRKVPWEARVCKYILPYYYSSFLIISQWYFAKTDVASLVVTATTGEAALRILLKKHHGISLVVTDLFLPDMSSSLEFLQKVETETRVAVGMMSDTFNEHLDISSCTPARSLDWSNDVSYEATMS
ncbi:uncharacterized protein LOC141592990 isoform X1 [Silene latifolia]|uniref:uncharacterized protein LOC141592990 isoform X1 n=2 Tax=Silene latifolia TaxID=37657 RepID=UPI003D77715E